MESEKDHNRKPKNQNTVSAKHHLDGSGDQLHTLYPKILLGSMLGLSLFLGILVSWPWIRDSIWGRVPGRNPKEKEKIICSFPDLQSFPGIENDENSRYLSFELNPQFLNDVDSLSSPEMIIEPPKKIDFIVPEPARSEIPVGLQGSFFGVAYAGEVETDCECLFQEGQPEYSPEMARGEDLSLFFLMPRAKNEEEISNEIQTHLKRWENLPYREYQLGILVDACGQMHQIKRMGNKKGTHEEIWRSIETSLQKLKFPSCVNGSHSRSFWIPANFQVGKALPKDHHEICDCRGTGPGHNDGFFPKPINFQAVKDSLSQTLTQIQDPVDPQLKFRIEINPCGIVTAARLVNNQQLPYKTRKKLSGSLFWLRYPTCYARENTRLSLEMEIDFNW